MRRVSSKRSAAPSGNTLVSIAERLGRRALRVPSFDSRNHCTEN